MYTWQLFHEEDERVDCYTSYHVFIMYLYILRPTTRIKADVTLYVTLPP